MIELAGKTYEILEDYQEGFQQEEVESRFSDILNKYDFIVGDWGYGQLRLKGFMMIKIPRQRLIPKSVRWKII